MKNNKQQTPVEYLENQIQDLIPNDIGSQLKFKNKIKQAKVMEKEQAIKLYYEYELYVMMNESDVMTFGQFYKQTFGGGEQ